MRLVVDLEATCWEVPNTPDLNEVIDIGIVVCDDQYEILDTWSSLIKPKTNVKLSSFCKRLTSIKQQDVDSALSFPQVISNFNLWFFEKFQTNPKDLIWFTWGSWDLKCLTEDCLRNEVPFPFASHRNLKDIYFKIKKCDKKDKLSLKDVIERENIIFTQKLHRGITDALAAAMIAKIIHPFPLDQSFLPNS